MKTNPRRSHRTAACLIAAGLLAAPGVVFAQDQAPEPPPPPDSQQQAPPGGWRRVGEGPANPSAQTNPRATMDPNYGPAQGQNPNQPNANQPYPNPGPVPARLTIKPGTLMTVRLNQGLSSDHNQPGDGFTATLAKPVVVDGVVVAERGQAISGRVVVAEKLKGVSRLGIQLGELTLADGNPVPIKSELVARSGGRRVDGRDVGTVAATTTAGAVIGGMADWGTGAAIGAGIGAVGGILGVMLTRGQPTVLYPEQVLTFRIDEPVTVSTERAPQAFRYVTPDDYERPYDLQTRVQPPPRPAPYYYGPAYPYPYYWGPRFYWGPSFYFGRGYWGPRYWHRGFYRWR